MRLRNWCVNYSKRVFSRSCAAGRCVDFRKTNSRVIGLCCGEVCPRKSSLSRMLQWRPTRPFAVTTFAANRRHLRLDLSSRYLEGAQCETAEPEGAAVTSMRSSIFPIVDLAAAAAEAAGLAVLVIRESAAGRSVAAVVAFAAAAAAFPAASAEESLLPAAADLLAVRWPGPLRPAGLEFLLRSGRRRWYRWLPADRHSGLHSPLAAAD